MYANAWSAAGEALTGITKEKLDSDRLPPSEALKQFLDAVGDRDLFTGEPDFDATCDSVIGIGVREMNEAKPLGTRV